MFDRNYVPKPLPICGLFSLRELVRTTLKDDGKRSSKPQPLPPLTVCPVSTPVPCHELRPPCIRRWRGKRPGLGTKGAHGCSCCWARLWFLSRHESLEASPLLFQIPCKSSFSPSSRMNIPHKRMKKRLL